jgi:hypothetical protein
MTANRWWKYFVAMFAVVIVETALFVSYYSDQKEQDLADRKILEGDLEVAVNQLEKGEVSYVDISKIARFDWDKLYIFGAYTPESYIDSILGIWWPWAIRTTIDTNDSITLLVFTRHGRVVHYLNYEIGKGNFSTLIEDNYAEYSYQDAIFTLDEKGRIIWVNKK